MLANRVFLSRLRRSSRWSATDKGANVTVSADRKTAGVSNLNSVRGEQGRSSGVLQFELTIGTSSPEILVAVGTSSANINMFPGAGAGGWGYYSSNGNVYRQGSVFAYGSSYALGDVIGVVFNFSTGQLFFYKNGVTPGVAASGINGLTLFPFAGSGTGTSTLYNVTINTGENPFAYPVAGASPWG